MVNADTVAGQQEATDGTSGAISNQDNQRTGGLLAAFGPGLFLAQRPWQRLIDILPSGGGGSYGVAGPRGAGKSWLIANAKLWADRHKGLGVSFPSPSEYEPMAFLAAISDVVAQRFQEYYDNRTGGPSKSPVADSGERLLLVMPS
jgi:hypothetical protein